MTTSRTSGVLTDEGENNARVNGSHSREMGFLKNKGKGQNENTVTKNACVRFPHRRGKAKGRVSEARGRPMGSSQNKYKQKQQRQQTRTPHPRAIGWFQNARHMHDWKTRRRQSRKKYVFEARMAENFPKSMTDAKTTDSGRS